MAKAESRGFFVNAVPYVAWDWNSRERNVEFIQGIESDYFSYIAHSHIDGLEADHAHLSAMALRGAYLHGLETLLTLLCAAVQAPRCLAGWILRCSTPELRNLVESISGYGSNVPNPLGIRPVSWSTIAQRMIRFSDLSEAENSKVQELFTDLWAKFAQDWSDRYVTAEYNSIKHGLRVRRGGFQLSIAFDQEQPHNLHTVGGGKFGTQYFTAEPVRGAPSKSKTHFRLHNGHTTWDPSALAQRLELISLSICNIKSFLLAQNGVRDGIKLARLVNAEDYERPWTSEGGISKMAFDLVLTEDHIERLSDQEVTTRLMKQFGFDDGASSSPA